MLNNTNDSWEETMAVIIRGVYLNAKMMPNENTGVTDVAEKEMSKLFKKEIERAREEGYNSGIEDIQSGKIELT